MEQLSAEHSCRITNATILSFRCRPAISRGDVRGPLAASRRAMRVRVSRSTGPPRRCSPCSRRVRVASKSLACCPRAHMHVRYMAHRPAAQGRRCYTDLRRWKKGERLRSAPVDVVTRGFDAREVPRRCGMGARPPRTRAAVARWMVTSSLRSSALGRRIQQYSKVWRPCEDHVIVCKYVSFHPLISSYEHLFH